MKHLILQAITAGALLGVQQPDPTGITSELITDSAVIIDRLAAALMISEETIRKLAKFTTMTEEDLNKIFVIIETSDAKMLEVYTKNNK